MLITTLMTVIWLSVYGSVIIIHSRVAYHSHTLVAIIYFLEVHNLLEQDVCKE